MEEHFEQVRNFKLSKLQTSCHRLLTLALLKLVAWVASFNCFPLFEGFCRQRGICLRENTVCQSSACISMALLSWEILSPFVP